jgi:hypothetical protein
MATYLQCDCGARLRAPDARPGRVGRCPACGSLLRASSANLLEAADRSSSEPALYTPTFSEPRDIHPRPPLAGPLKATHQQSPIARGGFLPVPYPPPPSLTSSWLYPFWDGPGLAWVLLYWIPLSVPTLLTFGLIPWMARDGGVLLLFGPIAFAFAALGCFAIGYLCLMLEVVITASAQGDAHHPRWPDADAQAILGSLLRWATSLAPAWGAASAFAICHELQNPTDFLLLLMILAPGLLYGLLALLSITLRQDWMAIAPQVVIPAIRRAGSPLLLCWLATMVTLMVFAGFIALACSAQGFWLSIAAGSLIVFLGVYASLVLARMLGMAYHKSARRLAWFRTKRRLVIPEIRTPTGA